MPTDTETDAILDDAEYLISQSLPVMKIGEERAMFASLIAAEPGSPQRAAIREHIVRANLKLVVSAARRSRAQNISLGERISVALEALTRAVEKFDPSTGYKFNTYAMRSMVNGFTRAGMKEMRHDHVPLEASEFRAESRGDDDAQEVREVLDQNTAGLTDVEMLLVRARYFSNDGSVRRYADLGAMLGVGKERARQILEQAQGKLRETLYCRHERS